jgi:hypothetical protein
MVDSTAVTDFQLGTAAPHCLFSAEIETVVCRCSGGIDDDDDDEKTLMTLQALKRAMVIRFAMVVFMTMILTMILTMMVVALRMMVLTMSMVDVNVMMLAKTVCVFIGMGVIVMGIITMKTCRDVDKCYAKHPCKLPGTVR